MKGPKPISAKDVKKVFRESFIIYIREGLPTNIAAQKATETARIYLNELALLKQSLTKIEE